MSGVGPIMITVSVWAAVGGIGSLLGAGAAWRAALASERTSREAREALAHAIEPDPLVEVLQAARDPANPRPGHTSLYSRVVNMDRWTANDLELRATFADGEVIKHTKPRLEPYAPRGDDDWFEPIRDVTEEWPPAGPGERIEIVLRYSDSQGTARHETTLVVHVSPVGDNALSVRIDDEPVRRRRLR
jgi:hypothetical protein